MAAGTHPGIGPWELGARRPTDSAFTVPSICDDTYILPAIPGQLEQVLLSWSSHVRSWTKAREMSRSGSRKFTIR